MKALLQYTLHDFEAAQDRGAGDLRGRSDGPPGARDGRRQPARARPVRRRAAGDVRRPREAQPGAAVTARLARPRRRSAATTRGCVAARRRPRERRRPRGPRARRLAFYDLPRGVHRLPGGPSSTTPVAAHRAALRGWPGSYLAHRGPGRASAPPGQDRRGDHELYGPRHRDRAAARVPRRPSAISTSWTGRQPTWPTSSTRPSGRSPGSRPRSTTVSSSCST